MIFHWAYYMWCNKQYSAPSVDKLRQLSVFCVIYALMKIQQKIYTKYFRLSVIIYTIYNIVVITKLSNTHEHRVDMTNKFCNKIIFMHFVDMRFGEKTLASFKWFDWVKMVLLENFICYVHPVYYIAWSCMWILLFFSNLPMNYVVDIHEKYNIQIQMVCFIKDVFKENILWFVSLIFLNL